MFRSYAFATLAVLSLGVTGAQAALQTWTLTATTYNVEAGFNAPSFARMGKTFSIDFVFDLDAKRTPFSDQYDFYAPESITVNGVTTAVDGYIWAGVGSLNAINVAPIADRSDLLNFVSLNNMITRNASSVTEALNNFSEAIVANANSPFMRDVDLRLDFSGKSVWATPTSFAISTAVPEPATNASLLLGLMAIAAMRRKKR
jgi:hypothetical protein